MFSHILVPLEFPYSPIATVRTSASLAAAFGAQITLLCVTDPARCFQNAAFVAVDERDIQARTSCIADYLTNIEAIYAEYDVSIAKCIDWGNPIHERINGIAAEIEADAIVMRTHGRRGIAHVWNGSITEDVIRSANLPVLVVRESSSVAWRPAPYNARSASRSMRGAA